MQERRRKGGFIRVTPKWLFVFGCGLFFLSIVYMVVTKSEKSQIKTEASDTMQFLQSICQKYDDYELGNLTSELQDMIQKAKMLSEYEASEILTDSMQLEQYANYQNVTGIFVLDGKMNLVGRTNSTQSTDHELLSMILRESNLFNIIRHPQKTYADQVLVKGQYYNYAIVSREDDEGAVICYEHITDTKQNRDDFSLSSLLAGNTFLDDATIVVTDGKYVIATNDKQLSGRKVEECPVVDVGQEDELRTDRDLFLIHNGNVSWYGVHAQYRNYYLYVFYNEKTVFAWRIVYLCVAAVIYGVVCLVIYNLWQHNRKVRLQQIEKEYHLINTIASIYSANLLIHLENDTWEPIVESDRLSQIIQGVSSAKEMLVVYAKACVHTAYQQGFSDFTNLKTLDIRLRGKSFIGYSFEDQENHWFQTLFIPKRDENGQVESVMLVFRNVTDQKQKEMEYQEKLRLTAEEAKCANAAKTDFLRRMSHDIRTPINGIRGMVEIGKHSGSDLKKTDECFDKILSASDFLLDLVNNVLDMSKLETGEIELEQRPFNMQELLKDSYVVIETQASDHGITFQKDEADGEHWNLIGSPLHIRQIFQNIMSNAVKYNRENGSIRVWCREITQDDAYATFEFGCEDTGIGMSEEFQQHAFETFAQEKDAARTTYSGTGLGLPIAKKLVEHMNGTIEFTSEQGVGTTFIVTLRLQINHDHEKTLETAAGKDISLQGVNILLVEDNELNMEISEYMLTHRGAMVKKAFNGQEAVELFEASKCNEIDVILMDIMMPVMDGLEATRCIRALNRADALTVPIIAMSANAFADDIARSRDAGMNAHLSKPLEFEKVCYTIHKFRKGRKDFV